MKRARATHVILLLFAALALRLPWLVAPGTPLGGDEGAYHALAVRLSDGRGFVTESGAPTAWHTPGLPGFLSLVYRATRPDPRVARVVLAVVTSLTAPALYLLSLLLFDSRGVALLAGVGWAGLPTSRHLAGALLGEPLAGLLLVLALLLTVTAERRRSPSVAGAAGLALGVAVLTRAFLLLALVAPVAWLLARKAPRLALAFLLTISVILGGWGIRNVVRLGTFTLSTETVAVWQGNNAWARGSWPGDWPPQRAYLLSRHPDLPRLDEVELSRLFGTEALQEIRGHPGRFLWLLPRKAVVFFSPASYLGIDWLYAGLLPFSVVGMVTLVGDRARRHVLWLLAAPVGGVLAVCLLVFGDPRFRHPVDPLLVLVAGAGLAQSAGRLGRPAARRASVGQAGLEGSLVPPRSAPPVLHVLYISYDGILEPIGHSQILPYLEGLSARGVQFTLLSFEKSGDLAPGSDAFAAIGARLEAAGIHWVPLRYHKRPAFLSTGYDVVRGAWRSWRLTGRHGIHLLHVRSYVPSVMALPSRWLLGRPLLFDIRGFWVDERVDGGLWGRGLLYRVAKRVERHLYRSADGIVSLTEAATHAIQELCAGAQRPAPIMVIPTCVALDHFVPRPAAGLRQTPSGLETMVFTYVGSVGTWAAMGETLDFFRVLQEEIPQAALLLIVRGPHDGLRAALERRGLQAVARVVSGASYGEVPRWLSASHAGLAFYRPGLSNVARAPTKIGEYLASGLPVVVSGRVGDCDQMLERERVGVSVPEFSAAAYRHAARGLRALLRDDGLADRCRHVAVTRLSLTEGVGRYHAIYGQLMANAPRRRSTRLKETA